MHVRLLFGDETVDGQIWDISSTHFKASFKKELSHKRHYRFRFVLPDATHIEGESRVDQSFDLSKDGEYPYIMLIAGVSIKNETHLIDFIQQKTNGRLGERRDEAHLFRKNRREQDRTPVPATSRPRVVITGIGSVSSLGIGRTAFWNGISNRTIGIRKISHFDPGPFPIKIAGEVSDDELKKHIPSKKMSRMGRATVLGWLAARLAIQDSELNFKNENLDCCGIAMGTTLGTLDWAFKQFSALNTRGYRAEHPYTIAAGSSNALSGEISVEWGLRGPSITFSQGCTSASMAIMHAMDLIQLRRADVMLAGGADAPLNPTVFGAFVRAGMLAEKPISPHTGAVSISDCSGAILGEGGCVIVLESYEHAQKRGAPILAEIVSAGAASDGYDMLFPHPSGRGLARAIRMACETGEVDRDSIDLILGHFAGLREPHLIEMRVLRREFGQNINIIPVTNVKPLIGYTQGANGAFEVAAACLAFQQEVPWITYNGLHAPKKASTALVSCMGFGGKNVSVVLKTPNV